MYDRRYPSVFVDEFLNPEKVNEESQTLHPNANKRWSRAEDQFLLTLHREGKTIKQISQKMGRSQTSIIMRMGKLGIG
jgi:DNA helicase-4